ncbi:MAG: hypothetical protein ACI959_000918 [Limisphaerales bacterium]|jgi:hypothetical protein
MMDFFKKYFEIINLGLVLLAFYLLHIQFPPAQGMVVILCATLAFFYLGSGILVLLDKNNVEKVMRIIWFTGLWAVAIAVMGIMSRLLFWESNEIFMMVAGAGCLASFAFIILNRMGLDDRIKLAYTREMWPLVRRLVPAMAIGLMLYFSSYPTLYRIFGEYRHDRNYIELISEKLTNPSNQNIKKEWLNYHDSLKMERAIKYEQNQ